MTKPQRDEVVGLGAVPPYEPEPDFDDWMHEFVVWLVRRGDALPMVVDSIWMDEALARKRAGLLGAKWTAQRYSHLKPPPPPGEAA